MIGYVARTLLALLIAAAVFLAIMFLGLMFGGAECDRGTCNWLGELLSDAGLLFPIAALLIGLATGAGLTARHRVR